MKKKIVFFCLLILLIIGTSVHSGRHSNIERGRLYVIGTGPAGPQMTTLQALETLKRTDVVIASGEHSLLFKDYIRNKPALFDPWEGLFDYKGKSFLELNPAERLEFVRERNLKIEDRVRQIKSHLENGKDVGLLDSGNPCLFAPCHWYVEQFDPEDVVIIPGMGSDAAAMAALGKSVIPAYNSRFVIQTSPFYLTGPMMEDVQLLKNLVQYDPTIVLNSALENPEKLFSKLIQVLPLDMPCAVVYWAGYPYKQKIVLGTVADMGPKLAKEEEKYMGLLFIGRFLKGKPYEGALRRPKR